MLEKVVRKMHCQKNTKIFKKFYFAINIVKNRKKFMRSKIQKNQNFRKNLCIHLPTLMRRYKILNSCKFQCQDEWKLKSKILRLNLKKNNFLVQF